MTGTVTSAATSPTGLDELATTGWLWRRAGFGRAPGDPIAADGPSALATLMGDDLTTRAEDDDPWTDVELDDPARARIGAIVAWLERFVTADDPYRERRSLFLHGWLVSSLGTVPPARMIEQLRLFRRAGGDSFPDLLRAITVDPAMLIYLDGRTSTAVAPNENYGRELLELFALGVGDLPDGSLQPYDEDDVLAVSRALTGWVVRRDDAVARFVPRRHDDTPVSVLGTSGVHDVDSVVDAIVAHPEHARFVARRVAREYVGDPSDPRLDGAAEHLATVYVDGERRLDPVIREGLALALDDVSTPIALAPIPWVVACGRNLDLDVRDVLAGGRDSVRAMGQTPMYPPSVAGWPGGTDWLTTAAVTARVGVAHRLAAAADDANELVVAAADGDLERVAALIGLREPFGPGTERALRGASDPTSRVALALVSPEALMS